MQNRRNRSPGVSIGLPVYNGEKYIEAAVDSILAQTYSDFELIISDNASTDRTAEICQTYAAQDKRIHYHCNHKNLGAAPNFNRVFELSSGQYFKWAAYDDLIAPDFLEKCVQELNQNPVAVLCIPRSKIINEHGEFIGHHSYRADTSSRKPHVRFRNIVLDWEEAFQIFGVIRSDILKKTALIGSYPASDLVLLAELTLWGKFIEVSDYLFFPRYHAERSSKGALTLERDRVLWFDTSLSGKIVLPKWQYLFGYLKAIRNTSLSVRERMYCYVQMIRWVLIPAHFRALGKDVLLATRSLLTRTLQNHNTTVRPEHLHDEI